MKVTKPTHRSQIQRLSQKPMLSQGPAGIKSYYLGVSKGSINGFKTIRRQNGGETAKHRIILGGL